MPLPVLIIMVVVGLSLAIGSVYWFDHGKSGITISEDRALEQFAADFPFIDLPDKATIDQSGRVALVSKGKQAIGLVTLFGQNCVSRQLTPDLVRKVEVSDDGIELHLSDFTLRSVFIAAEDGQKRKKLETALGGLLS